MQRLKGNGLQNQQIKRSLREFYARIFSQTVPLLLRQQHILSSVDVQGEEHQADLASSSPAFHRFCDRRVAALVQLLTKAVSLKPNLSRELEIARIPCARDSSKWGSSEAPVWIIQWRRVRDVEYFGAKFETRPLRDAKCFS